MMRTNMVPATFYDQVGKVVMRSICGSRGYFRLKSRNEPETKRIPLSPQEGRWQGEGEISVR